MNRNEKGNVNIRVSFTQKEREQIEDLMNRWNLKKSNVVKMLFMNFKNKVINTEYIVLRKITDTYDSRMVSEFPCVSTITVSWDTAAAIDRMCAQMGCIQRSVLVRIFVVQELYQMKNEKEAG